jgi:Mg2+ and Co2+ transporter CorA
VISGCWQKTLKGKNMDDFKDYSTIIMDLERTIKSLEHQCLNKKYEDYLRQIGHAHSKLSDLLIWMLLQEKK